MCTLRHLLYLVLLQVFSHRRNVSGRCFIKKPTECKRSNSVDGMYKHEYKFSLGRNVFKKYFCNHTLVLGASDHGISIFNLEPTGEGQYCSQFDYHFYGEHLYLSTDCKDKSHAVIRTKLSNPSEWRLQVGELLIGLTNYDVNSISVQLHDHTSIPIPYGTTCPGHGINDEVRIKFRDSGTLISKLSSQISRNTGWILYIGPDLDPDMRIIFRKKTSPRSDHYEVRFLHTRPFTKPDPPLEKPKKNCLFWSCWANKPSSIPRLTEETRTITLVTTNAPQDTFSS